MRILHMAPASARMMNTYVKMIREHCPLDEHRFLYWDKLTKNDQVLLEHGNSAEVTGNGPFERMRCLYREMKNADAIIWHGITFGAKRALFLSLFRSFLKKSIWVVYGIDLYNWKKDGRGLKTLLTNKINYFCRKHIPYVGLIHEVDIIEYERQFCGNNAKSFYVPYPISKESFEEMERSRNAAPRPNGKVYVQVSHNAFAFNNHLYVLDSLAHFKDENIRLVIPLSYGNTWYNSKEDYAETVMKKASELFGSKATCLTRLMPQNEYTDLLCNIDVAVFGSNRQNALGNILKGLYVGNKVFLSVENPLYRFFLDRKITVFPAEEIKEMDFEAFKSLPTTSNAVPWIRSNFFPDVNVLYWKAMFQHFGAAETPQPDTEEFVSQVNAVLAAHFENESQRSANIQKSNYVCLTKYCRHPRGTQLNNLKKVSIVGTDSVAFCVYWDMMAINQRETMWIVDGFVGDPQKGLAGKAGECDVKYSVDQLGEIETHCVLANRDIGLREKNYAAIRETGNPVIRYVDDASEVLGGVQLGEGAILLGGTKVNVSAVIGNCTHVIGSKIGAGAEIGSFCNIDSGCTIGADARIGDRVQIGENSVIASGALIPDHTIISPNSVVMA